MTERGTTSNKRFGSNLEILVKVSGAGANLRAIVDLADQVGLYGGGDAR